MRKESQNTKPFVCDQCKVIFWSETGIHDCKNGEKKQGDLAWIPSLKSDIGAAVRIAKDKYVPL